MRAAFQDARGRLAFCTYLKEQIQKEADAHLSDFQIKFVSISKRSG